MNEGDSSAAASRPVITLCYVDLQKCGQANLAVVEMAGLPLTTNSTLVTVALFPSDVDLWRPSIIHDFTMIFILEAHRVSPIVFSDTE